MAKYDKKIKGQAISHDAMMAYLWWETDKPWEFKFGERWVKAGQHPLVEVWRRIKNSVGVRKDLINEGKIELLAHWDVSEYAKKVGRFYPHGKVDDHMRRFLGQRKGSTGEIHTFAPDQGKLKIDQLLARTGQPLPSVGLAAWQARTLRSVLEMIANGDRIIMAELCARFGKTIWAGALARELDVPLTIVASYVLTSFASFEKDLSGFDQFKDLVIVDSADPEYQDAVDAALANGKQVVVFLSMCAGERRQQKIDYLFGLSVPRLLVIDEADFGVQRPAQASLLVDAMAPDDAAVLMTGTEAAKASALWPIDNMISVVYPELVMEKRNPLAVYHIPLQHFAVDTTRHDLVVDMEFYQMTTKSLVESFITTDPSADRDLLASWSKTAANPAKAKGFLTHMLQSLFMGQHGHDELNSDLQIQTGSSVPNLSEHRVSMMFMPGSTTNANLAQIAAIAQQALLGYKIVPVYGEEMTNRTAETDVKDAIAAAKRQGQSVLLISAGMAQRSFSVGEISEIYLAYDEGSMAGTIQKVARALTPTAASDKVARLISLSFDPNRDDKFDAMILETAANYNRSSGMRDMKAALDSVLRTLWMFRCTPDSAVRMEADQYLEDAISRRSVSRVIGQKSDLSQLSSQEVLALSQGNSDAFRSAKLQAALRGKTRMKRARKAGMPNTASEDDFLAAKIIATAKKVIANIADNMDIIVYGTGTHNLNLAFEKISNDASMQQVILEEFGLEFDLIHSLFDRGVINIDLIELQVNH